MEIFGHIKCKNLSPKQRKTSEQREKNRITKSRVGF